MKEIMIEQLKANARGYYIALMTGTRLDIHKERVASNISTLLELGESKDHIQDILSDISLSVS